MVLPCWTQRSTAAARPYSRSSGCAATQSARDQDSSKEGRRCSCDRRSLTLSRYTRLRRHGGQGSAQVPVVHDGTSGDRRLAGEEHMSLLTETVAAIIPASSEAVAPAVESQSMLTKPLGSLGALEELGTALCGMYGQCPPPLPEPVTIAVFAGDHGVHAQGVSPWPQEVTTQMVGNFLAGGAVINAFGRQVGAEVVVIDIGVAAHVPQAQGLTVRKIAAGTADMTRGPAMTAAQVQAAIEVGIDVARDCVALGSRLLVTGDMGIANTTASAALIRDRKSVG